MLTRFLIASAAGAIAAAATAVPAFAAGPVPVMEEPMIIAPVIVPSADWTGPYVGAQLGWGWASGDTTVDLSEFDLDNADADLDGDGWVGGLTAGYRYDFGQWVVGGEVQYDWAGVEFDELDISSDNIDIDLDLDDDEGSLDSIWRAKALVGYDLGRTLIYGSAGWAHATGEFGGDDLDGDGWVVGAGADYTLTENVTLGGEAMWHQFSDFGGDGADLNVTTLQAKLTFRF